jgi:hypothetical protein
MTANNLMRTSFYGCFLLYVQQIKHWVGNGHRTISNNLMRLSLPVFTIGIELHIRH